MAEHNDLGKLGEKKACEFLTNNGYEIIEKNWVYDKAEIDIIAQKSNVLAIIEVKTRSTLEFGLPQDFVKPAKIRLLVKAVNEFINQRKIEAEVRFDIIAIHKENDNLKISHLENAFYHF